MKVKDCIACVGCPFREKFPENNVVPPRQGTGLRLAIGEAPGEQEAERGEPFVGGSGNWLRGVADSSGRRHGGFYGKAGVKDETITFANVLSCRPPGNIFPTDPDGRSYISKEDAGRTVAHCVQSHLLPVLRSRPWTRIDLIGDKPLEFVAGRKEGVMKWRGSPMALPALGDKLVAIPTLHPSYVARDQDFIPVVINDLRKSLIPPPEDYNLQPSIEDVQNFTATEFVADIETPKYRLLGDKAPIEMVGLCDRPYHCIVVPFQGAYVRELKRIFGNATNVITQNGIQFDMPRLQRDGIGISADCRESDVMLLQHLRFPNLPHDLEFIASCFSNKPAWKHDKQTGGWELYCARDCDVTMQAYKQLWPMIQQEGMVELYENTQVPLAKLCAMMKENGVKQDPERLRIVREQFLADIEQLSVTLPEEMRPRREPIRRRVLAPPGTLGKSGKPVKYTHVEDFELVKPYRSGPLKQKFLYETLALPKQYHPKTKELTTDKSAIDKLLGVIRRDKKLEETDRAAKMGVLVTLKGLSKCETLVSGFLKDGGDRSVVRFIHPSFNVHGTKTGRLSSSDPNFQNQPETARYMYVPRYAGWEWASIDFSGIENRIMALRANDTERLRRMNEGISEHKLACSMFFDIPYEDVVKDNDPDAPYNKAKHVVHGTDRAMGAKKINLMYGIEFSEAKRLQNIWKDSIKETIAYQEAIAKKAERDGVLVNVFGRKQWFYTQSAYTESISFEPQSIGADVIFRSMIALGYERIGWPIEKVMEIVSVIEPLPKPANMLISVHDSLEFEYPRELREKVLGAVYRVMTQPWPQMGGYSFPVSVSVGPSWGEVKPISMEDICK